MPFPGPFSTLKMVQIAHAIRALACISFRYIVGPASPYRPRLPVVKPVPMFFGEPGPTSLSTPRLVVALAAAGAGNHSVHARPFSVHRCKKSAKGALGDEKDVGVGGVRRRDSLLVDFGHSLCVGIGG